MFELIIFIISCFFVYIILGNLIIKIKGDKLGCISFSFTIFISILFSLSISKKLNPNKAETFFFREQITKKTDDYKSNYQLNNKDYLEKLSKNSYYNFLENQHKGNEINIGCLCRDGIIVSSINNDACSNNDGIYEFISLEIEKFIPEKTNNYDYTTFETTNSRGQVHVRSYYRKDGTYVRAHTRTSPRR